MANVKQKESGRRRRRHVWLEIRGRVVIRKMLNAGMELRDGEETLAELLAKAPDLDVRARAVVTFQLSNPDPRTCWH